ncbi:MAG: rRNA maturation RNase YbeY [Patescibacteria group bacterium]
MLEINNTTRQKINPAATEKLVDRFLRAYKQSGAEVSLAIVGDARMKSLNRTYRGIDKTTDVLSFSPDKPGTDRGGRRARQYLGEIVINIQEARRIGKYRQMLAELNLNIKGRKLKDYLFYFLLVHGLLHLIGYDDTTDHARRKMLRLGREFLEKYQKF